MKLKKKKDGVDNNMNTNLNLVNWNLKKKSQIKHQKTWAEIIDKNK